MSKIPSIASFCVKEYQRSESTKPHQLPIYATSSFDFDQIEDGIDIFTGVSKGHVYSRYGNPTMDTVANKLAVLEGYGTDLSPFAVLTNSGMSAISTLLMATLQHGDYLLTQGNLYGGTTELLQKVMYRMGVTPIFVNLKDLDEVKATIKANPNIKMVYFETPANPTLACIDIAAIVQIAKEASILTAIDNTFCTPINQQPLALGVDFVIHSTTKFLNGHGNSIAGVVIGRDQIHQKAVWTTMKLAGTNCNPWDAWLLNNGLKTLALRMKQHESNAIQLAQFLESHPKVNKVNYNGLPSHPDHELAKRQMSGFGGMLSFEIKGGQRDALKIMNALNYASLAPTLGDVDTLVLHPATSSHLNVSPEMRVENGITEGLIRVSVGIEEADDLINDFEQALSHL